MEDKNHLKILMTADTIGGVWTYCMELCRELKNHKAFIHLITMGAKMNDDQRKEINQLEHLTVYETEYALEWMQNPWEDIEKCGLWMLELESRIKPDIIHLNTYTYGAVPFSAPVILVAHSDVYSLFHSVKKMNPPVEWKKYYEHVKQGLQESDLVIAPSVTMMNYIKDIYNYEGENNIIYNGRNIDFFNASEKQPMVFSMGRIWDEAKNIQLLLNAATNIKWPVIIAGENIFENEHFNTDHQNTNHLGRLSGGQVAEQLSKASIFVHPAKYEPFGLSALEAALSGCALVLGDIPSYREIWKDAALYADTDDEIALADIVNRLIEDKDLLKDFSNRAVLRAADFSSQHMAQNYTQVYKHFQHQTKKAKQETI